MLSVHVDLSLPRARLDAVCPRRSWSSSAAAKHVTVLPMEEQIVVSITFTTYRRDVHDSLVTSLAYTTTATIDSTATVDLYYFDAFVYGEWPHLQNVPHQCSASDRLDRHVS